MKLLTFFLFAAIVSVQAEGTAQSITLSGKSLTMKQVFAAIEKQTGYVVFYRQNQLEKTRPVTVTVTNMPLQQFLDTVLWQQQLDFSIKDKTIILSPRTVQAKEQVQAVLEALPVDAAPLSLRVTDSLALPLEGVSVVVMAHGAAVKVATTDKFGVCKLQVKEGDEVHVRLVGYEARKIHITAGMLKEGNVTVILKPVISELSEIAVSSVNTGYQRIRPEQSTGAVAQISTKEYESRVSSNFIDGLVNRLPGLMINNSVSFTSTAPGSTTSTSNSLFNIRGISTMSANQTPLVVIDGYPTELTLDMLDPNEIKSVTILKDAAAATVYGVRASNGVIVIERKQASQGKAKFTFRATAGITPKENYSRYRWVDNPSAVAVNYQKDIYTSSVSPTTWSTLLTSSAGTTPRNPVYYILAQSAAKVITPYQADQALNAMKGYDNIDEYNRLFQRPALTQTYNINVSGGNPNALYYITANYTRNKLSDLNNDNNRLLLSARNTLKFSQRLSLELTTDYQEQRYNSAPVPGVASVYSFDHYQDVNGNPAAVYLGSKGVTPFYNSYLVGQGLEDQLYYPLREANEVSNKTRTVNNRVTANFIYTIGGGFNLSFGGIYETSRSDYKHLATGSSFEVKDMVNHYAARNADGTLTFYIPKGDFLQQQVTNTSSYTGRAQLNYNKKIGGLHSFNGILGAEIRRVTNSSNLSSLFGYNDQTLLNQPVDFSAINTGAVKNTFGLTQSLLGYYPTFFNQAYVEDRYLSGYANMVYSFKNTYSLSGSIRIDQSNLFGTNPKYKYKPLWSLGAAWNIHQESFMKGIDWLNILKLRVAYGFNGNVAKMSVPEVIAQATTNTYTSSYSPALKLFSYANSSLRWEQTRNTNIGLDYRVANNINGTIDYYIKRSTDLLGSAQIDPTIGTSPSLINQATIDNRGIEISLHADWITTSKFNWNTGLVLARNTSKVLDVFRTSDYKPQSLSAMGYVKGFPVGALFAFRYAGLDTAGYPLITNTKGQLYSTINSSSTGPTSVAITKDTSGTTRYMGSSIPTINAGLSNRLDIGNFYVYCMVNYYGGFKVRVPRPDPSAVRALKGAGDYWKAPGDETKTDVMALKGFNNTNSIWAYNYADKYVVNGDYITLADLTVSYSFDNAKLIKKAGFTHFEVKCQASNLWTVGLNKYNYSAATGSYQKSYLTPTYTLGIFTNF
ncbi:outer membrane protein [Filimonas lacunae]|nr:outer membrane protein [Filimonas lacunae]